MSGADSQSVKLSTPLLERAAAIATAWTDRDRGVVRWTRALVLDVIMLRGLEVVESTTAGGQPHHPEWSTSPPGVVADSKETQAPARKRTRARTSAGARYKQEPSEFPTNPHQGAPQAPPHEDLQENWAPTTRGRAYIECSPVEGASKGGSEPAQRPHEVPGLTLIPGGAGAPPPELSDPPAPMTPEEDAAYVLELQAKLMQRREEEARRRGNGAHHPEAPR